VAPFFPALTLLTIYATAFSMITGAEADFHRSGVDRQEIRTIEKGESWPSGSVNRDFVIAAGRR
jgi:hypothetical protein